MPIALWQSWSEFGRVSASAVLKIPVEGVIPTTNHLESFNGLLKRKHLNTWLRSGHRLRFDFLINILITKILPAVYSHRNAQKQYKQWLADRFKDHAGGTNLAEIHAALAKERSAQRNAPLAWWNVDPVRDATAQNLVHFRQLIVSKMSPGVYQATCHSTAPVNAIQLAPPISYTLELHQSGSSTCSCPDFCLRDGACKHLRALRLIVDGWVNQGFEKPFHYPKTRVEATLLRNNIPILQSQPMTEPPPTPLATPMLWDPAFIQSLGQDSTTLDDQEITDTIAEDSDSNSDSGADPTPPPSQQNQQTALTEIHHQSAIAIQIQQRLNYELKRLLPPLHGLGNLLTDASMQGMTSELEELSELLSSMQVSVDRIRTRSTTGAAPESLTPFQPSNLPSVITQSGKRSRPFLLPPSPERRQKRKDSHAPL